MWRAFLLRGAWFGTYKTMTSALSVIGPYLANLIESIITTAERATQIKRKQRCEACEVLIRFAVYSWTLMKHFGDSARTNFDSRVGGTLFVDEGSRIAQNSSKEIVSEAACLWTRGFAVHGDKQWPKTVRCVRKEFTILSYITVKYIR